MLKYRWSYLDLCVEGREVCKIYDVILIDHNPIEWANYRQTLEFKIDVNKIHPAKLSQFNDKCFALSDNKKVCSIRLDCSDRVTHQMFKGCSLSHTNSISSSSYHIYNFVVDFGKIWCPTPHIGRNSWHKLYETVIGEKSDVFKTHVEKINAATISI